jgi:uncharacterized protein (DUF2141 family)
MKLSQQIRPSRKVLVARALLLLFSAGAASTVLAGELTIEISGVTPDQGKVYVAVYDGPETFPISGKQLVGRVLAAGDRHLTAHFADLPPGQYAVVAFQDFNGNGRLDKNLLGIPKEPYGFSNGARGSMGPPKFAAAAITLGPNGTTKVELK